MPIGEIAATTAPTIALSWQRREFPSPDAQWAAVYSDAQQNFMGVVQWQLSLRHPRDEAFQAPEELLRANQTEGWMCPSDIRPWRCDSEMMVALPWDRIPKLFDPKSRVFRNCSVTGAPLTAQWGNRQPHMIAVYFGQIDLLDGLGRRISRVNWESEDDELPYTGWTQNDEYFFVVRHRSRSARTQVAFFRPEHPPLNAHTIELNPNELVPYDGARYSDLPRWETSLVLRSGQRIAATFLDTWNQIWFDPKQHRLLLSVFRPAESAHRPEQAGLRSSGRTCPVEDKWISVCLRT